MYIPTKARLPRLDQLKIEWRGRQFLLPYLYREGTGRPSVLFVHGLGGAKENFHAAFQSPSLADCTLVAFDEPGTGLAVFDPDAELDVSALAEMTQSVAAQLLPGPYFVAGASMGGLISLLQLRRYVVGRIQGMINLEGNLCPEDCTFSRRVVSHQLDSFEPIFEQIMGELRKSRYAGDQIIAHNMALNMDIRGYYAYSFETVKESDSGHLLKAFLEVPIPRLFLYGEANGTLSYLPRLRASSIQVTEIPSSAHFFFYDNPVDNSKLLASSSTRRFRITPPNEITAMKQIPIFLLLALAIFAAGAPGQEAKSTAMPNATPEPRAQQPRVVELKAPDGTMLKGSYFAAAKPGPGVLLFHQSNRPRQSWDEVARQLAAAGINTLTLDNRGHGESGGTYDAWTEPDRRQAKEKWLGDLDTAFQFLVSQPGVQRDVIGLGGAGLLGVNNSVETARRHPAQVKSLALLSGETFQDGLQFLREASQLPGLFVVADDDEYPPTVEAMELLYITSSNPAKKFVHYSAAHEAHWLWYEPVDVGKVPATGGHGTDLFKIHPELPGIIVDWFVTTLIKTPGHAPADTLASAPIINQIRTPGGPGKVTEQLNEARAKDPKAQLFPEITVGIVGADYMRAGDMKSAIEVMQLIVLAYPDSADAHDNLANAYLKDGQKDLARQHAEKALALLDSHVAPASSWSDTEQKRGEIRTDVQQTLKKLGDKR